jgi:hypothetical protein
VAEAKDLKPFSVRLFRYNGRSGLVCVGSGAGPSQPTRPS